MRNPFIQVAVVICILTYTHCQQPRVSDPTLHFRTLMHKVELGWSTQDTELALSSFSENAIYMQPPNIQFYQGQEQLRAYFGALTSEYKMEFHHLWFDERSQTGVGEFTFSYGKDTADVGITVIELDNGKIKRWREYLTKGPVDFETFLATENKDWIWHIGNYPAPPDSLAPDAN